MSFLGAEVEGVVEVEFVEEEEVVSVDAEGVFVVVVGFDGRDDEGGVVEEVVLADVVFEPVHAAEDGVFGAVDEHAFAEVVEVLVGHDGEEEFAFGGGGSVFFGAEEVEVGVEGEGGGGHRGAC